MLEGLTIIRDAFARTVRLVSTARLRPPVLAKLVDDANLAALAEIEGATSARRLAETHGLAAIASNELVHGVPHAHFINASFVYARPYGLNRFNGPDRGAWYAALNVETCIAEVAYHMTRFLADAGSFEAVVDYAEMHASFAGEFLDLRSHLEHPALGRDEVTAYPAGTALAQVVRSAGLNGIIYPSVRHSTGTCFAILFPHAVQSVAQGDVWRLQWGGSPDPLVKRA